MKKINRKINIITDIILAIAFIFVFTVSFVPEQITPIYSDGTVSAIYNGNRQNKKVSLMFNVYENAPVVEQIIDLLQQHGAKATFFVGGCWADDNGETLKKIVDSGNELGNHGYFHKDHKKLSYEKNLEEISNTGVIVKALCGAEMNLFAPPSGSFGTNTLKASYELGYKTIMWSKDTIDWRDSDKDVIYTRATKNVTNGDLILMHPKQHTLLALSSILEYYNSIGLSVVTVSENLS